MREFPEGTQILTSPPPSHALHGKYFGRLAILPDFREILLDKGLIPFAGRHADLPSGYLFQHDEELIPVESLIHLEPGETPVPVAGDMVVVGDDHAD